MTEEEKKAVLYAYFVEGKEIETRELAGGSWVKIGSLAFDSWDTVEYRVKPEPPPKQYCYVMSDGSYGVGDVESIKWFIDKIAKQSYPWATEDLKGDLFELIPADKRLLQ